MQYTWIIISFSKQIQIDIMWPPIDSKQKYKMAVKLVT